MGKWLFGVSLALFGGWLTIRVAMPDGASWFSAYSSIADTLLTLGVFSLVVSLFLPWKSKPREEPRTAQKTQQSGVGNQTFQIGGSVGELHVNPPERVSQDQTPQVRIGFVAATGELTVENRSTSVDACRVRLQSFSRGGISVESETLDLLAHRSGRLFRTETTYINQHGMRASAYGVGALLTRTIDPVQLRLEFSNAFGQQFYRMVTFPTNSSVTVAIQRTPDFEHGPIERIT